MADTKYLIVGASHAGLSALNSIRAYDPHGSITMLTRDDALPYSPTVIPHVVSRRIAPDKIFLRTAEFFTDQRVSYIKGTTVEAVNPQESIVTTHSGETISYEKLLIATGSAPVTPPIPGMRDVPIYVLRTLSDALQLREAAQSTESALIVGGGLVGLHAAESLGKLGLTVTVVEMADALLGTYFDGVTATSVEDVFVENGIRVHCGERIAEFRPSDRGVDAITDSGLKLSAGLAVLAVGVAPSVTLAVESGIRVDHGIVVDDSMRTNHENVWAAGDVTQAKSFFGNGSEVNPVLPDAVDQGRIAGMAMSDDPHVKPYFGAVPQYVFTFFGSRAFAVGLSLGDVRDGYEIVERRDPEKSFHQRLVFAEETLVGAAGMNGGLHPGILWNLVRNRTPLGSLKRKFTTMPEDAQVLALALKGR